MTKYILNVYKFYYPFFSPKTKYQENESWTYFSPTTTYDVFGDNTKNFLYINSYDITSNIITKYYSTSLQFHSSGKNGRTITENRGHCWYHSWRHSVSCNPINHCCKDELLYGGPEKSKRYTF